MEGQKYMEGEGKVGGNVGKGVKRNNNNFRKG